MNNKLLHQSQLNEGLEAGDLKRLVKPVVVIDEFKSKMGSDEDILVLSFEVQGKEPALDLVNFVEKGYAWVADADVSSGELDNGSYMVFIEAERQEGILDNIYELFDDLVQLTSIEIDEWTLEYYKPSRSEPFSKESLNDIVPSTPEEYRKLKHKSTEEVDQLKTAAGVKVNTKAPKNDYTESLRVMAGLK
jgi:hypothetical protein